MEVYSECEGTRSCFAEKGGGFPLAANGKPVGSLSGVCTFAHTSVLRTLAYKRQRANVAALESNISYHRKSVYKISVVEQLIEKGAVPNVPRATDSVIWIQRLECLSATARICTWIAATIGCFSV